MNMTKWGIIGPGDIARKFIEDLELVHSPQKVCAVLGHTADKTDKFAKQYGIPGSFTDLDEFLHKDPPDVIYIATPHTLHYEYALKCLENRIPVLCEKPLTINAEQCQHLLKVSWDNHTFLMEGMWIRFLPSIQQVMSIIENGIIGKVISVKASMTYKAPKNKKRFFDPELGGGALLDLGIYPVFLANLLLGKPNTIKALGKLSEQGIDEACSIMLNHNNYSYALPESSIITQSGLPAEIAGENGVIKILHPWFEKSSGIELDLYYNEGKIVFPCQWEGHGFQFEIEEVLKCIRNGEISSGLLPHQLSLDTIETLDEIRRQINVVYEIYE
jgi:predicted dehydrogenase